MEAQSTEPLKRRARALPTPNVRRSHRAYYGPPGPRVDGDSAQPTTGPRAPEDPQASIVQHTLTPRQGCDRARWRRPPDAAHRTILEDERAQGVTTTGPFSSSAGTAGHQVDPRAPRQAEPSDQSTERWPDHVRLQASCVIPATLRRQPVKSATGTQRQPQPCAHQKPQRSEPVSGSRSDGQPTR